MEILALIITHKKFNLKKLSLLITKFNKKLNILLK